MSSIASDGTVRVWDTQTHALLHSSILPGEPPFYGVLVSPDRSTLFVMDSNSSPEVVPAPPLTVELPEN